MALAVKHFLPYFESRLPMLSGQTKSRYENIIVLLNMWKSESPKILWEVPLPVPVKICLPSRVPPTLLQLPRPPRFPTIIVSRPRVVPVHQDEHDGMFVSLNGESSEDEILAVFENGSFTYKV